MTYPTAWQFLKITSDTEHKTDILIKVFASWYDSWRLNSGCTKIEDDGVYWVVTGESGSTYYLRKNSRATASAYAESVLCNLLNILPENVKIEKISVEEAIKEVEERDEVRMWGYE